MAKTKTKREDDPPPDEPLVAQEPDPVPRPLDLEPAPEPDPAEIKAARYDYDGVTIMLAIRPLGSDFDVPFVLRESDQNGLSPFLREELARMVTAGEIVIGPAPIYDESA